MSLCLKPMVLKDREKRNIRNPSSNMFTNSTSRLSSPSLMILVRRILSMITSATLAGSPYLSSRNVPLIMTKLCSAAYFKSTPDYSIPDLTYVEDR